MKSSLLLASLPLALAVPRPVLPPISFGVPSPAPPLPFASPNTPSNIPPKSPPTYGVPELPAVTATVTTTTQYIIIAQLSGTTYISTIGGFPTGIPGNHAPATTNSSSLTSSHTLPPLTLKVSSSSLISSKVTTLSSTSSSSLTSLKVSSSSASSSSTSSSSTSSSSTSSSSTSSSSTSSSSTSSSSTSSSSTSSSTSSSSTPSSFTTSTRLPLTNSASTRYVLTPVTTTAAAPSTVAPAPTTSITPTTTIFPTLVPTDASTVIVVQTITTADPTTTSWTTVTKAEYETVGVVVTICEDINWFVTKCVLTATQPLWVIKGPEPTYSKIIAPYTIPHRRPVTTTAAPAAQSQRPPRPFQRAEVPLKPPASEPRDPPLSVVARGTSPQRTDPKNRQLRSFSIRPAKISFSSPSIRHQPRELAPTPCPVQLPNLLLLPDLRPAVLSATNHPISDEPPDSTWTLDKRLLVDRDRDRAETLSDAHRILSRLIAGYALRPQSCCALPARRSTSFRATKPESADDAHHAANMSVPLSSDDKKRYTALIDEILSTADLETISRKKDAIKKLIEERFDAVSGADAGDAPPSPLPDASSNKRPAANGASDYDDASASPEPAKKKAKRSSSIEDADARLAAQLQAQENRLARSRTTRGGGDKARMAKKKKAPRKKSAKKVGGDDDSEVDASGDSVKKRKAGGGFQKPFNLSETLSALCGETQLSRPQVVKKLWEHIKANDLQDPADKRQIRCDEKMQAVFKQAKVDMFRMNKDIGSHLYPVEE
ncbi:hypothetical protein MKX08_001029 [Trichoderma sp. CBMAI-0020]|nr:hypothetical protein MKX08_001029 [Trichoderma sp. CBMAI-0020]